MLTVPAFMWRGGRVRQALMIGGAIGLCFGALAWLDSGFVLIGVVVFVVVGAFYGIWMPRRMARYWPESSGLTGDDRAAIIRAVRHGERIDNARLAQPVIDYRAGLHAAAETGRSWRWLLVVVLVVAAGTAVWDAVFGSWGNAVASALYLAALAAELLWWPKKRATLLTNADAAAAMAQSLLNETRN